jgi:secondary thiamine-phosphate synthase enzyme
VRRFGESKAVVEKVAHRGFTRRGRANQTLHAARVRNSESAVKLYQQALEIRTSGHGFVDITPRLVDVVSKSGCDSGTCTVFVQHTSASLVIQENADPAVLRDLERWMTTLAPESRRWEHDAEGPDDMPAHARSALTRTSEVLVVSHGRLALGTWQAVYLWEHRERPHTRRVLVHVMGE